MIYSRFYIKDFKGIDEVSIDLLKNRIITLVGLNESGKTTIMEAIKLYYTMIQGQKLDEAEINQYRPKGIDFTGHIILEGKLLFENEDVIQIEQFWKSLGKKTRLEIPKSFTYTYKFEFELHSYKKLKTTCLFHVKSKRANRTLYYTDREGWQKLIIFINEEIIPEIIYYDDFMFNIPENISFIKGADSGESLDNGATNTWRMVFDDILKAVNSRLSFQSHVINIWDTDNDTARNRISQIEERLNEKITQAWKDLFQKDSNSLNFKEIKLKCESVNNQLNISFEVKTDLGKIFSINERSKGCKWFFSFLTFTEFRKHRAKNILFLLDEPASNLHSSAQNKILNAIEELSDKSLVIYSTHSHHLIRVDWLSGSYVVINEKLSEKNLEGDISFNEGAKITAKKYFNYVGTGLGSDRVSYFQPILDALDYQPSSVEPIPNIIILEGKNDWYTFKYFSEVIIRRTKVINFYPGGGKDKLADIIRLYLAWGKMFIVMLDGDRGGIRSKDKYIRKFGEYVNNRIFCLKDVFEREVVTEGLIEEPDKRLIYETIYGPNTFHLVKDNAEKLKVNVNNAICQLLVQKKRVNISAATVANLNKLFGFIEKKIKDSPI